MRSLLIVTCAIFAGYSNAFPTLSNFQEGDSLDASVITSLVETDKCYLVTPSNETVNFKPDDESGERYELLEDITYVSNCRVRVLDLTPSDNGIWTLYAVVSDGTIKFQAYEVTVYPQTVLEPVEVTPEYLDEQVIETTLGGIHTFNIPNFDFITSETCEIINPNGERFNLKEDIIDGVELNTLSHCGVTLTVTSEDQVGHWTLIEKGKRHSTEIERRLPITVSVEVIVQASLSNITVAEHNNIHISLASPTSVPNTCRLVAPDGASYVNDQDSLTDNCEYSILDVTKEQNGTWAILYGERISYRAPFDVHVIDRAENANDITLMWTINQSVQEYIGPENAIYCKVSSPNGEVFEGFGRCYINVDRVSLWHVGTWRMAVGLPGHVLAEETSFYVKVESAATKPTVVTNVEMVEPSVTISCTVQSSSPVQNCNFRDPRGQILIAHEGVSQARYSYYRSTVSHDETNKTHTCGLTITNPTISEVGFWRCGMQADDIVVYGHLNVRSSWLLKDPEVAAAIPSEPLLAATPSIMEAVAGNSVTLACYAPAPIRYCYFRASNGTIYNVAPGSTSNVEYVGAGLDSGECSVRLLLAAEDSGVWSCHAATEDQPEQSDRLQVYVTRPLNVHQYMEMDSVTIKAQLKIFVSIDYCVFVRSDGIGFTRFNAPDRYTVTEYSSDGSCQLDISRATEVERRAWTVIVHKWGQSGTEVQVTDVAAMPMPPVYSFRFPTIWLAVILVGLCMVLLAAIMSPNKNRRWVASRASSITTTFRNSFRKSPQNNNTPVAA